MVNYCQTKIVKIQPKHNIIYLRPSDSLSHSVGNEWYVSDHGLVLCEVMSLTCGDPDQSKHKNDLDNNKQPFLVILWAPDLTSSPTVVAMNDMWLTITMVLCLQSDIIMMCSQACPWYKECRDVLTASIWMWGNGTGAPASTEIEMVMNIYTLIGDAGILSMTQLFQILTDAKWKKGGDFQRKTHAQAVSTENNIELSLFIFF